MSWLSKLSGIGISPKGVKIDPLKALGTVATLGSGGLLGPLAGIAGKAGPIMNVAGSLGGHGKPSQPMDEQLPPEVEIGSPGYPHTIMGGSADRFRRVSPAAPPAPPSGNGVLDWIGKHPELLIDSLAAAEHVSDRNRRNKMQDKYSGIAQQNYDANAPLRDQGRSMMLDQSMPDASSVFAPSQQRYRKVQIGSRVP